MFCSLDAVKKALKKKETRGKMEIVEVLQQASYRRKIGMMKLLDYWMTLMSSFAIPVIFKKSIFRNLTFVLT